MLEMSHFDPKTSSYVYKNYFWNAPAMAPAAGAALKVDFKILYKKSNIFSFTISIVTKNIFYAQMVT